MCSLVQVVGGEGYNPAMLPGVGPANIAGGMTLMRYARHMRESRSDLLLNYVLHNHYTHQCQQGPST